MFDYQLKKTPAHPLPRRQALVNIHKLECYIERMRTTFNNLNVQDDSPESRLHQKALLNTALEELSGTIEELQVAEEELREQNAQLESAQLVLEAERQRYQSLFEFAPDGYLVTDLGGGILEANHAAADLLNIEQRFLLRKPFISFIDPDERHSFRNRLNKLRTTLDRSEWQVVMRPRRSPPFYAALSVALVEKNHDEPAALRWMVRDISDRMSAELALRLSEERYRAFYQDTPAIYFTLDRDGIVLAINRYGAEFLGYKVEELVGQRGNIVVYEEDRIEVRRQFVEGMDNPGRVTTWELRKIRKNGSLIWVKETMRVTLNQEGLEVALIVCQDITDLKSAEDRLERARAELDRRVQDRTRDLTMANSQLQDEVVERKRTQLSLARQARKLSRAETAARDQARILQSVLDNMNEGVLVVDQEGKTLLTNPAAIRIGGKTLSNSPLESWPERYGIYQPDMVSPCPVDELPVTCALRGEEVNNTELFVRPRNMLKGIWLSANAKPLRDSDSQVYAALAVFSDISERKQNEQRLETMAQYDMLTGLPNRNLFRDRLNHAMARAARGHHLLALMFLDLDHFKDINDTLGHDAGDLLLKATAERLRECLREGDTVARLGGDEFTMILEEMHDRDNIAEVAEKVLKELSQSLTLEGQEIQVTTSIGIALYPGEPGDSDNMLKKADVAMYHAKNLGRNNFQFYARDMTTRASDRLSMESKLRHALEHDELRLFYQPQLDLRTGLIVGVEALLRWQHPEFGLMPDASFVELAEKTGMIIPLGDWVLNTACKQNKAWQDAGLGLMRVSTNQSSRQFKSSLVKSIMTALSSSGLDPQYLDLEITESLLMENIQYSSGIIAEVKAMGITVSIDDFGTGYSSLSYLKYFALDSLKIDSSFVRNITTNSHDAAIGRAIITLGHSLGLRVIAEGVETPEQLAFLREENCDVIQGYLFGRPMPAEDLAELLRNGKQLEGVLPDQLSLM